MGLFEKWRNRGKRTQELAGPKVIDIDLLVHPFWDAVGTGQLSISNLEFMSSLWKDRITRIAGAGRKMVIVAGQYSGDKRAAYQKELIKFAKKKLGKKNLLVYSNWLPIVPLKIKKHIEKLVGTNNLENRLRVHSYGEYNNKCVFAICELLGAEAPSV